MERISSKLFYQYFICPSWVWFDRFGDPARKGATGELQQKLIEQGVAFESQFMHQFFKNRAVTTITANNWDAAVAETTRAMKAGAGVIYQGRLRTAHYEGIPDLLMRRPGKSKFGEWYYEPIDIKSAYDLKDEHKYQLMLYTLILADVQGFEPPNAGVITASGQPIEFKIEEFRERFFSCLEKIELIVGGEKPPMQLTKACTNSPWFACCLEDAEKADDIALLYKVDKRALKALREFGICTVEDARHIDPESFGDKIPYLKKNGLERMKLQAESLKTGKIFPRHATQLPSAPLEIYFDIEGDPLHGVDYLFGVLVFDRSTGSEVYQPFLAEHPEDEPKMWREFVDWIKSLPSDYVVFHYAPYETARMKMFAARYAADMDALDRTAVATFTARLFDLNDVVKEDFIFPIYFYGLKQICKFLGFDWRSAKAGGAQSIFWYEEWLTSGNREILNTVVDYNEDDVRATKFLRDWIHNFAS